jgi:Arc/MetJ family transcription regulator
MRVTVEIEETILKDVMKITDEKKKGAAISKAVTEFVKRRRAAEFGRLIKESTFDYPLTNDDVES